MTPAGNPKVLFDGFAQIPQVDLTKVTQSITFVAIGVATRLWDLPILGRVQRDADRNAPGDGTAGLRISQPCQFNPSSTVVGSTAGYLGNWCRSIISRSRKVRPTTTPAAIPFSSIR